MQSNMEYPIGSPTCWNASNINCTSSHNGAQCGFGCTQDAGQTIADMAGYDSGMRLFNVGSGTSITPQPEMRGGEWKTPSEMGGAFSATCWFFGAENAAVFGSIFRLIMFKTRSFAKTGSGQTKGMLNNKVLSIRTRHLQRHADQGAGGPREHIRRWDTCAALDKPRRTRDLRR